MEAISKYYLEDGHLEGIDNYTSDSTEQIEFHCFMKTILRDWNHLLG